MTVAVVVSAVLLTGLRLRHVVIPRARGTSPRPVRLRTTREDLAAFLDAVAREVRSGASLGAAVVASAGGASVFAPIAAELHGGAALGEALRSVRLTTPDVALAVRAVAAAADVGGPVAATLDGAARVLRERQAARAERHAHSAQARLSARVLTVVPLAFAVWNAASSERSRTIYRSGPGMLCVAAGLILNVAGWQWMRRTIQR